MISVGVPQPWDGRCWNSPRLSRSPWSGFWRSDSCNAVAMAIVSPGIGTPMPTPTSAMIWALANCAELRLSATAGPVPEPDVHIDVVDESGAAAMAPATAASEATANKGADIAATTAVLAGMGFSSSGGLCRELDRQGGDGVLAVVWLPGELLAGNGEPGIGEPVQ